MLERLIADLGANYKTSDEELLNTLIDKATTNALFISNRSNTQENLDLLEYEILECVKTLYLRRGTEDVSHQSQSGISATYQNAFTNLRNDIIQGGKRLIK